MLYNYNRFQACRYGLEARVVDAYAGRPVALRDHILETLGRVAPHAASIGDGDALDTLRADVVAGRTDAEWLRAQYKARGSMNDVAREQSTLWMEDAPGAAGAA
jgi:carboxylate-amine ligase